MLICKLDLGRFIADNPGSNVGILPWACLESHKNNIWNLTKPDFNARNVTHMGLGQNRSPEWNPGKWKQKLKLALPWFISF